MARAATTSDPFNAVAEPRRREMGAAGRKIAEERYSWDAIAERLVEIYDGVTGRLPTAALAAG